DLDRIGQRRPVFITAHLGRDSGAEIATGARADCAAEVDTRKGVVAEGGVDRCRATLTPEQHALVARLEQQVRHRATAQREERLPDRDRTTFAVAAIVVARVDADPAADKSPLTKTERGAGAVGLVAIENRCLGRGAEQVVLDQREGVVEFAAGALETEIGTSAPAVARCHARNQSAVGADTVAPHATEDPQRPEVALALGDARGVPPLT